MSNPHCRYMKNVGNVLEGIKGRVPAHGEPVVRELAALVGMASDKLSKYSNRGLGASIWHLRSETV